MKLLVIGGMHGNEPLGVEVVELFKAKPVNNVDVVLANSLAINQNSRFAVNDLNRMFPGDSKSDDYETRRAAELLRRIKDYDIVLDFHNTHCPDNDCGFVGNTATNQLYNVSGWLGLTRVIVADYDCINKYAPNCLSVEISLSSEKMNAEFWYTKIAELSTHKAVPASSDIEKYSFVYRMTLDDKEHLQLGSKNLRAFCPIDPGLADKMDVPSPAYPIFINDRYTPYNYGGLLNRLAD